MITRSEARQKVKANLRAVPNRDDGWRELLASRIIQDLEFAGAEFAPDLVEPVVGALLTENTRLVNGMAVIDGTERVWQYDASAEAWYSAAPYTGRVPRLGMSGCSIIYVPKEEVKC